MTTLKLTHIKNTDNSEETVSNSSWSPRLGLVWNPVKGVPLTFRTARRFHLSVVVLSALAQVKRPIS